MSNIRMNLINECLKKTKYLGRVISGDSLLEDELTHEEFGILFKKQLDEIKKRNI